LKAQLEWRFADWLIMVTKRIKLEMEIGQKDNIEVRKEASLAIEKMLAEFNSCTRIYESERKSVNGSSLSRMMWRGMKQAFIPSPKQQPCNR
jgi:hypothetical protein